APSSDDDTADVIEAVWLLAGLEEAVRSGRRVATDPATIGAALDPTSRQSLRLLLDALQERQSIFAQAATRSYAPTFGLASRLLQGADADLLLGDELIEVKATAKPGYCWQHAAQLVAYVTLAAMDGVHWPIRRAGIYQARYGRMLWLDVEKLANSKDLWAFGDWLAARSRRGSSASQVARLRANLRKHLPQRSATGATAASLAAKASQVAKMPIVSDALEKPMATVLRILLESGGIELHLDELCAKSQALLLRRSVIQSALYQLARTGQAKFAEHPGDGQRYWSALRATDAPPPPQQPAAMLTMYTLAIVDVETTGLSANYDRVVEVFVQLMVVDNKCQWVDFGDSYHSLHDPGVRIPSDAFAVHGISNAMVKGQRIDNARLADVLAQADMVIAHNSGFDKGFVRHHVPDCDTLTWGCSCRGIPWRALYPQVYSAALPELARVLRVATGTAHRARGDVETTCRLLLQQGPDGLPHGLHLMRKKLAKRLKNS
ncbi:MAG: hypothetical protein EXR77_13710, partial [Myxococcales bacterium]|nr:hypothetical protein [Myxococcales bacterium]